ncbi:FadR family transcriptional regulator [Candidatus Bipolaricaulota bacterium]|nr:FadR family transcriptional regulator [Candidatus Bipolaricaulota bacterium]
MAARDLWPAPQPKKSTLVARWVLEQIRARRYPEGTKLPSEREIAQILRVSRPPVREALSALQIAGIVEIRPGDGTYVKSAAPVPETVDTTLSVLEEGESPFEVMQVRRILEEGGIRLAIERATEEDIARLEGILEELGDVLERGDLEAYFPVNRRFHLALASATQNSLLHRLLEQLMNYENTKLWREAIQRYLSSKEHLKGYLERHRRILEAVRARDVDRAVQEMRDHFTQTVEEVREYL